MSQFYFIQNSIPKQLNSETALHEYVYIDQLIQMNEWNFFWPKYLSQCTNPWIVYWRAKKRETKGKKKKIIIFAVFENNFECNMRQAYTCLSFKTVF